MTRVLCAAALAASLAGCADEGQTVVLRWAFDAAAVSCAEAGVQTVHVFIGPLAPAGAYDHEIDCSVGESEPGAYLRGVAPGPHVLVLKGLARDRVHFSLQQEIVVPAGTTVDLGTFVLPEYVPPP